MATTARVANRRALLREEGLGCADLLTGIGMNAATAEDCGRAYIEPLPPRALLLLSAPWELRAARYAQRCVFPPVRPDVAVLNAAALADADALEATRTLPPYAELALSEVPAPPPTPTPPPCHPETDGCQDVYNRQLHEWDCYSDALMLTLQALQQVADDNGPPRALTAADAAFWPHPANASASRGTPHLTGRPLFVGGVLAAEAQLSLLDMAAPFGVTWAVAPTALSFYDSPRLRARMRAAASAAVATAVLQHGPSLPDWRASLSGGANRWQSAARDTAVSGGVHSHAGFSAAQATAARWLGMGATAGEPWPWRPSCRQWYTDVDVSGEVDVHSLLTAAAAGEAAAARVDPAAGGIATSHPPGRNNDAAHAAAVILKDLLTVLASTYEALAALHMPHEGGDPLPTDVPWPQPGGERRRLVRVGDSVSLAAAAARRPAQLRARHAELVAIVNERN